MIAIRDIDQKNVLDVMDLTTNKDGIGTVVEEHVCCNAVSIAEARYFPGMEPRAIYRGDELIGFFMYTRQPGTPEDVEVCRYMLDHKFMGQGLGRQSFAAILDYFRCNGVKRAIITLDDENTIAKHLYVSFGFTFTGKIQNDEHYYGLNLGDAAETT